MAGELSLHTLQGAELKQTGVGAPCIRARSKALTWFLSEMYYGCLRVLALTLHLSPRKQLPSPASVHPSQAMFLPGLQRDPRPASHHVQEALLPLDLWVWTSVFTHLSSTVCCLLAPRAPLLCCTQNIMIIISDVAAPLTQDGPVLVWKGPMEEHIHFYDYNAILISV